MQVVPLTSTARQILTTTLGDQIVTLRLRWQPLSEAWYLTMDHGDTRLVTARQLTPWERVLREAARGFDGDFLIIAARGQDHTALGRKAWTETHALWYLTNAELAQAGL
ncbi:MAG: hypothetical protein F4Y02_14365 [Chloroflexi bacterium]|nr:hypothetical protein [Chloroflexota bacterium]